MIFIMDKKQLEIEHCGEVCMTHAGGGQKQSKQAPLLVCVSLSVFPTIYYAPCISFMFTLILVWSPSQVYTVIL